MFVSRLIPYLQPVVAFAGEHCHPSFYSTVHGAYLSGKSAAQFFLNAEAQDPQDEEQVFNLGAASIADLSTFDCFEKQFKVFAKNWTRKI